MQCWLQQIVINSSNIVSNKLLYFSYKSLNALSEKIMFLWDFCHPLPMVFYDWNTSISDSSDFSGFFLGIISWEGLHFSMREVVFQNGGFHFKLGVPHGGIGFDEGWFKKNWRMRGGTPPPCYPPPPLLETLYLEGYLKYFNDKIQT